MPSGRFYAVEIDAARPGGSTRAITKGFGIRSFGALARRPLPITASMTIRASDAGYRSKSTDPGGLQVYPPLVSQAFAISRNVALSPAGSGVAAAAGKVLLANPKRLWDATAAGWNVDGRTAKVLMGVKAYEDAGGTLTVRPTTGTYRDANGVMREAAAGVVRWDYTTGSPVALNEAAATNLIRNPRCEGAVVADGVERAVNGTFAANPINASQNTVSNGWQWSRAGGTSSAVWTGSALVTLTCDGMNAVNLDQQITGLTNGHVAKITVDVGTTACTVQIGTTQGGSTLLNVTAATGTNVYTFTAGATVWLRFQKAGSAAATTVDNVSVQHGGKLPTNWQVSQSSGIIPQVVGAGTEDGIPYIDVRVQGTTTGTTNNVFPDATTAAPATAGLAYVMSVYTRLIAGSLSGMSVKLLMGFYNSVPTSLSAPSTTATTPTGAALRTQRQAFSATAPATTAYTTPTLQIVSPATTAVDATVRFGALQHEQGSTPTSVVLPPVATLAASTRAADLLYTGRGIWLDPSYTALTPVFSGLAMAWYLSNTGLEIPLRDATYWLEQPLLATYYTGAGGYGGHAGLIGVALPKTRGGTSGNPVRNVTPVLVDPTNRIYQYSDAPGTVVRVYEAGNLAFTAGANVADLLTGSTTAGTYRTDNTRGCFQLGSTPVGEITCDVTGAFPVAGVQTNWANILRYLLAEDCAVPSANLNTTTFTAAASAYPYTAGVFYGPQDQATGVDASDRILSSVGAKLVPARAGTLGVVVLRAIASTATAVASFGTYNAESLAPENVDQPPYRIRLLHNRNHTQQAAGVSVSATAANRAFIAGRGEFATFYDSTVASTYRRARDLALTGGALLIASEAQTVVNALGALFATRRRAYWITVPVDLGRVLDIGDVVRVTWPMDDLAAGALGRVVGDDFRSQDSTMRLRIFI